MTQSLPNANAGTSRPARRRAVARRRGYISLLSVLLIVIGVATLVLVVDWTFLVFTSRRTLQVTDTLALTAVSELLDEQLLETGVQDQSDDELDATTVTLSYLSLNNDALGSQLQASPGDMTITAGRVDDTSMPATGANFDDMTAGRLNSLRVEVLRDPGGVNPVQLLMRGWGAPETAKISSSSIATLDSRVIGYRPQESAPSPVAPLAVSRSEWESIVTSGTIDDNADGRKEYDFYLKYTDGSDSASAALLNLDASQMTMSSTGVLQMQIEDGIFPIDVDPSGLLGPFSPGVPDSLHADDVSPAGVDDLADSFNTVAGSNDPRRVFLLYDTTTFPNLNITGFVAGRVVEAEAEMMGSEKRLRVRLEPAFIIHKTTETSRYDSGSFDVPENDHCHKIRLTR